MKKHNIVLSSLIALALISASSAFAAENSAQDAQSDQNAQSEHNAQAPAFPVWTATASCQNGVMGQGQGINPFLAAQYAVQDALQSGGINCIVTGNVQTSY